MKIDVSAFECTITDEADVFIGPERPYAPYREASKHPYLFVVLPSFSFKVKLTPGNCALLRTCLDEWSPAVGRDS